MSRIGIDARFYGEAGPGRYVKNIISSLERIDPTNDYYIFLRPKGFELYDPVNLNFHKVLADYKWYSWGEQLGFLIKLISYKLNLFYVPHFNFPVLYPGKLITAIPDLIMHTYSTERGTTLPKSYFMLKKFIYKIVVFLAVARSSRVIVPSVDVQEDFLKVLKQFPTSKYVVAEEGVDPYFIENSKKQLSEVSPHYKPYILYISSMYEHKNVARLLKAFKILIDEKAVEIDLILIGKKDKYSLQVQKCVTELGLADRVFLPGNIAPVSDEQTLLYRKHALLYVFPSLKEGFSLTPMEAQVMRLACAISDIPVHREIYLDTVAYFDPYNERSIATVINDLLLNEEKRKILIDKGLSHYKKYSWDKTAEITLQEFNRALG